LALAVVWEIELGVGTFEGHDLGVGHRGGIDGGRRRERELNFGLGTRDAVGQELGADTAGCATGKGVGEELIVGMSRGTVYASTLASNYGFGERLLDLGVGTGEGLGFGVA
jgi:hypothetical protein